MHAPPSSRLYNIWFDRTRSEVPIKEDVPVLSKFLLNVEREGGVLHSLSILNFLSQTNPQMSFTIWDRTSLSAFFPWPDGSECPLKKALSYYYFPLATKKIEANLPYVSDEGKITSALFYESCCSWNHRKNCFSKISRKRKSCVSYEREHSCGCFYRLVCMFFRSFQRMGLLPCSIRFWPSGGREVLTAVLWATSYPCERNSLLLPTEAKVSGVKYRMS
jgi:hypothetical protein